MRVDGHISTGRVGGATWRLRGRLPFRGRNRITGGVEIIKLAWIGTRTERPEPTMAFFRDVLDLRLDLELEGFWMLKLPDGSKVEVFDSDNADQPSLHDRCRRRIPCRRRFSGQRRSSVPPGSRYSWNR